MDLCPVHESTVATRFTLLWVLATLSVCLSGLSFSAPGRVNRIFDLAMLKRVAGYERLQQSRPSSTDTLAFPSLPLGHVPPTPT
jgi:hypothetical protein